MNQRVGYCTNIHAGVTLNEVKSNLEQYALPIRNRVSPNEVLPVGLWLSQTAAEELVCASTRDAFCDWLAAHQLEPYTFNGFPFGDFHQKIVKHQVYLPTWADESRLRYTKNLADIQCALLNDFEGESTISTLPLGWPTQQRDGSFLEKCSDHLIQVARYLVQLKERTGRSIRVCIEPEPGCILDTASDLVEFFQAYLFRADDAELVREHLGVCHDVCHSAVMFEKQVDAVAQYNSAGIVIGKVQVSSALQVDFEDVGSSASERLSQLSAFAEPRYLHQTCIERDGVVEFFEDLGQAISKPEFRKGLWRIHFHVPIFLQAIGRLGTTQAEITRLLECLKGASVQPQWEIETYAWNVIPEGFQGASLDETVAQEISWFQEQLRSVGNRR